ESSPERSVPDACPGWAGRRPGPHVTLHHAEVSPQPGPMAPPTAPQTSQSQAVTRQSSSLALPFSLSTRTYGTYCQKLRSTLAAYGQTKLWGRLSSGAGV